MKMGVEKKLRDKFSNLGAITAVNTTPVQKNVLDTKYVNDALKNILPAVRELGGELEISSANDDTGEVIFLYSGPAKLKNGIELILKDNSRIKIVTFVDK